MAETLTPEQFSARIKLLAQNLIVALPQINEKAALNATSLVKARIVNTGVSAEDDLLGAYVDGPYKKHRDETGRRTDFVNLSYTGQMFRDIGVKKNIINGTKVITSVGAKDTKNRSSGTKTSEIVEGHADRYGNFLKPNKEEASAIGKQITADITKVIINTFKA